MNTGIEVGLFGLIPLGPGICRPRVENTWSTGAISKDGLLVDVDSRTFVVGADYLLELPFLSGIRVFGGVGAAWVRNSIQGVFEDHVSVRKGAYDLGVGKRTFLVAAGTWNVEFRYRYIPSEDRAVKFTGVQLSIIYSF